MRRLCATLAALAVLAGCGGGPLRTGETSPSGRPVCITDAGERYVCPN